MSSASGLMVLGLGANLGDPRKTLSEALQALEMLFGPLRVAPCYRTRPISELPQPDFYNTVAIAELPRQAPRQVLALLKKLEADAGRVAGPRNGPRPLDLDLLLFGDQTIAEGARENLDSSSWPGPLTLPHPRLRERRFVLQPLSDLEPDLELPPDRARVTDLLLEVAEQEVWSAGRMAGVPGYVLSEDGKGGPGLRPSMASLSKNRESSGASPRRR